MSYRGKSIIPRGLSRFFILSLLREGRRTGKGIIEEIERRTQGAWRPSPGLIYPLLGRLLEEGLIEEADGGYGITPKGEEYLAKYAESKGELDRRLGALIRLFSLAGFLAHDLVDRVSGLLTMLREDIERLGKEQRERYKAFLRAELERLEEGNGERGKG